MQFSVVLIILTALCVIDLSDQMTRHKWLLLQHKREIWNIGKRIDSATYTCRLFKKTVNPVSKISPNSIYHMSLYPRHIKIHNAWKPDTYRFQSKARLLLHLYYLPRKTKSARGASSDCNKRASRDWTLPHEEIREIIRIRREWPLCTHQAVILPQASIYSTPWR